MTAAQDAAIGAEGLVRDYPAVRAVAGIDLTVERGQVFGFLGANGSGKTTTIRMLTTLLRPTAGRAFVDGLDVERDPTEVRRRIGVALQEAGLDDLQTGRELLALQGRLHGVPRSRIEARVAELLAIVDLEDAADRRIGTYSGGMQRRLDLASALVHGPGIVFLDEPTSGLDPISRDALWRYVEQLNREDGVTFFLTTQYLEEADRLADEVAIIDAGRIVAQGSPANLKATIGADVVTMHVDADNGGAGLARAVLRIEELEGLEEVRTLGDAIVVYITDGSRAIARLVTIVQESGLDGARGDARAAHARRRVPARDRPPPRSRRARGVSRRAGGGERMTALVVGTYQLAWRAVRETIRQPGVEVGNLFIPLFFFFVTVGAISNIAGSALGIENYEAFQLPVAVVQGVAGAAAISGVAIVKDIESGYFDKLLLTPMPRLAIVLGRLIADGIRCAAFTSIIIAVLVFFTGGLEAGPLGFVVIIALAGLFGVAYSGIGVAIGLRTGNAQAAQAGFLIFFPLLFLSPAFAPKEVFDPWMEFLASINPVTYLLEGMRTLALDGWEWDNLAGAFASVFGLGAVTIALALWALRTRTA